MGKKKNHYEFLLKIILYNISDHSFPYTNTLIRLASPSREKHTLTFSVSLEINKPE